MITVIQLAEGLWALDRGNQKCLLGAERKQRGDERQERKNEVLHSNRYKKRQKE